MIPHFLACLKVMPSSLQIYTAAAVVEDYGSDRSSRDVGLILRQTLSSALNRFCRHHIDTLERFSKPNFGSIRRFRTMTGLEIEN